MTTYYIEVSYCPIYPLKLYGFDNKTIYTIESEILETNYSIEPCSIVWLGGKYTYVPLDSIFLSPSNKPSRKESYNRECSPPDVHYGSDISEVVYHLKLRICTPNIRPLYLSLKSGPVYLYISTLEI